MFGIIRHTAIKPQNAFTAEKIRFVPYFKELQISWTANNAMSLGLESFVDEYLPKIRENNPQVNFRLLRTHIVCDPFLVGIYDWDRKRIMRCSYKHKNQILSNVEEMSIGGDFREGKHRGIRVHLPRGQELWHTETRGHDIFKVFSKYKADPPDPNEITSATHPHFILRKVVVKGGRF